MSSRTLEEQLTKYLTDVHAIERQALVQMRAAPKLAGDQETVRMADRILAEERAAAEKLRSLFANALDGSLRELSLPAR